MQSVKNRLWLEGSVRYIILLNPVPSTTYPCSFSKGVDHTPDSHYQYSYKPDLKLVTDLLQGLMAPSRAVQQGFQSTGFR